jgi:hypothetical protein
MLDRIDRWLQKQNIPRRIAVLILIMTTPIVVATVAVIPNILGNRADRYLEDIWLYLSSSHPVPGWVPTTVILLLYIGIIAGLILFGNLTYARDEAQGKHRRASLIVDLALLQSAVLTKMIARKRGNVVIQRLLTDFLIRAVEAFGEGVYRASIMRPDRNSEYLAIWAYRGLNPSTLPNRRYNISRTYTAKRGVAGYAFVNRTLVLDRIHKDSSGQWMGQHSDFMPADPSSMDEPRYKSFVAAPIRNFDGLPVAVLCIDSNRVEAFDDTEDLYMIDNMAAAIGPVILAYYALRPDDAR